MKILIKNGHVVDPANNLDDVSDILVEDKKIIKVAKDIKDAADKTIDATGRIVMPGIVDMHVHLREPGREDKETVASGTQAAIKGGVTSVLAMPNTEPAMDDVEEVKKLKAIVEKNASANVYVCAAITKDRAGKELTDIVGLSKEGVVAISDDGCSVDDEELFKTALKKAGECGIKVICHCEDKELSADGVVNKGLTSTRMGLRGISKESEYKRIERDIALAKKTGVSIHIAHVSCKESVEVIKKAKEGGVEVTCETAPHYFSLTEAAVLGYDTNMKMNPPLRGEEDRQAIKEGLRDGTIDTIASDHAPHTENEKEIEFDRAEFGTTGLETELAVSATVLVGNDVIGWPALVEKMCLSPAKILGIDKGTLGVGKEADIAIVDPDVEWTVEKDEFASQSGNCAFIGAKLKGKVVTTLSHRVGGTIVPPTRWDKVE